MFFATTETGRILQRNEKEASRASWFFYALKVIDVAFNAGINSSLTRNHRHNIFRPGGTGNHLAIDMGRSSLPIGIVILARFLRFPGCGPLAGSDLDEQSEGR